MSHEQLEYMNIRVNDIVSIKRDTPFFSNKTRGVSIEKAGSRCLVADFSYKNNIPEALILEKAGADDLRDFALATVAFDAVEFHSRPSVE